MVYSGRPCDPQLTKSSNPEISLESMAARDIKVHNIFEDDLGIPIGLRKG